jgi:hypothetical protein
MTTVDSNSTKEDIKNALYQACRNDELEQVRFILTSSQLKYRPSVDEDNQAPLVNALVYGNYEIAKYLLTSPELNEHGDEHLVLGLASQNDALELVKFLFDSPQFEIDIHYGNDSAFEGALTSEGYDVLKYFIFERNIEKTKAINELLEECKEDADHKEACKQVKAWFETRQVNIDLNNNLESNKTRKKPSKL